MKLNLNLKTAILSILASAVIGLPQPPTAATKDGTGQVPNAGGSAAVASTAGGIPSESSDPGVPYGKKTAGKKTARKNVAYSYPPVPNARGSAAVASTAGGIPSESSDPGVPYGKKTAGKNVAYSYPPVPNAGGSAAVASTAAGIPSESSDPGVPYGKKTAGKKTARKNVAYSYPPVPNAGGSTAGGTPSESSDPRVSYSKKTVSTGKKSVPKSSKGASSAKYTAGGYGSSAGGTGSSVGGTGSSVGGTGSPVGGTGSSVGGTGSSVGGTGSSVGGTGSSVGGTGSSPTGGVSNFIRDCLDQHNLKRSNLKTLDGQSVSTLSWNDTLAKRAEEWAMELLKQNGDENEDIDLVHSSNDDRDSGENLVSYLDTGANFKDGADICIRAVEDWYKEWRIYKGEVLPNGNFDGYGHYTQLAWDTTRALGCGYAVNKAGIKVFVACHYYPKGNIQGQRLNVQRPSS
jgi:hypothetical protein